MPVLLHKAYSVADNGIRQMLILPQGFSPAFHVADAAYAVNDSHVVAEV